MPHFIVHSSLVVRVSAAETLTAVKQRYRRVRRLAFLARLRDLGLAWIVEFDAETLRGEVAPDFDDLAVDTQAEIVAHLAAAGLADNVRGLTAREVTLPQAVALEHIIEAAVGVDTAAEAMIRRRAERLHASRTRHFVPEKLRPGEVERLVAATGPLALAGPETVHAVDELWAGVHAAAPWMAGAAAALYRAMRGAVTAGRGPLVGPVLLWGAPGIGKTTLPRRLGALMGAPVIEIDAGLSTAAFRVAGSDRTWASSQPGDPIAAILRYRVANPIVVVNEIDRVGGGAQRSDGTRTSLGDALLTLLDRGSAASFGCPYFGLSFDMSAITWVLTANTLDTIDPALLSRAISFEIPRPAAAHVAQIVRQGLADLDPETAAVAARLVAARWDSDPHMTLRQVTALMERLRATASAPRFH